MKMKKTAAITAFVLASALFTGNGFFVNAEENESELKYTEAYSGMYRYQIEGGTAACVSGTVSSGEKVYAVPAKSDYYVAFKLVSIKSDSIEAVALPDTVAMIGMNPFLRCPKLRAVSIPESVNEIEKMPSDTTIIGKRNTYAEYFAKNNGNTFLEYGDINLDGKLGAVDVVSEMHYLLGDDDINDSVSKLAADMNGDGNINVADFIRIKKQIIEPESKSNIESLAEPDLNIARSAADEKNTDGYISFSAKFSDNVLLDSDDEKDGSNRIYSPLSIYMASSVLAECTEGQTLDELLAFLNVSDKDELREINKNLFSSLYFDNFDRYSRITNSLWIDNRCTAEEDILNRLSGDYFTAVFNRNLGSEKDCGEISEWIYQNTSGKFRPQIKPDADAILKIINTVTFKEKWTDAFLGSETGAFTSDDCITECEFMKGEAEGFISENEKYVKFTKSFNDEYCMSFILPGENETVESLVSDSELFRSVLADNSGNYGYVNASIPKFSSNSKFNLIPAFQESGVTRMFETADINPLLSYDRNDFDNPYIGEFTHEAVIDVNKKGCEAAAYTLYAAVKENFKFPYVFRADRPFIYCISDTEGTPLFIGTVNNPNEK